MAYGYDKQPSSRPFIYQVLQYNSATVISTFFNKATQQIRVAAQCNGWGSVDQTTGTVGVSSAGGTGMLITGGTTSALSVVYTQAGSPEYFSVTAGQFFSFSSTSTSTFSVTVTEMC
mgnify:CR=1 FL=1